jgi:hypothetical protein
MLSSQASAQEDFMRGGRMESPKVRQMDRGNSGGMGTGAAIGLGVGLGGALIEQLAKPPPPGGEKESRKSILRNGKRVQEEKTRSRNKPDADVKEVPPSPDKLEFFGKPEQVVHNPGHHDGKLGDLHDHKLMVIQKDGHYFRRHYYYTRPGGRPAWFWYDEPVSETDPVIPKLKEVPVCEQDEDDCDQPPVHFPLINVDNPPPANPPPPDPPAVKPPNVPVVSYDCPDCDALRRQIFELEMKTRQDTENRDNFSKYHSSDYSRDLFEAFLKTLDDKLADDASAAARLAALLKECLKKCPAPPPDTCSIVEGTGEVIEATDRFDCHGRKGTITVSRNVTVNPIPSMPKLAKAEAEGKPLEPLYEPLDQQFSIKYTGTPCGNCRWLQLYWEEELIKRDESGEFTNIEQDPKLRLSSKASKQWYVDSVSKDVEDIYVGYGADRRVFEEPAYCIDKYSMGLRVLCVPGEKDGTEQIFDRPRAGSETIFGKIARQDVQSSSPYAGVVRIKYVVHFETYLVCGPKAGPKDICGKVCWKSTFEWSSGMGRLELDTTKWARTYELEKDAGCGSDGHIQTDGDLSLNEDQKKTLRDNYPTYVQPQ